MRPTFELDSEEATHCHHCHLISCVFLKGLVNTKDQSNASMYKNDVKGVKGSLNSFNSYSCYSSWKLCLQLLSNTAYRVLLFLLLLMLKGSKGSSTMYCTLYTGPLTPARREGYLSLCLGGLAVHHQSVWGGSFVYFLGLVKLQGWLQARCTANSQCLKLRGDQQTK